MNTTTNTMTDAHKPSPRLVVIGTGYVGLPAALMWAKAGLQVVGVDIDDNIVNAINDRTMLINEEELAALFRDPAVHENLVGSSVPTPADIFVIAVPTPVDRLRKSADLRHVEAAIRSITPLLERGNLVIIESTIPPMTCRDVIKPLIEELTSLRVPQDVRLAHCPERILPGDIFHEIVHNDRLVGGMDADSTELATQAYRKFVKGELHRTSDIAAELSKLMENAYRDVNIALANEFAGICETLGADAIEVIKLANKHPRVQILSPGIGVGGHCIPVDPWFLKEVAPYDSRIIGMARAVNDDMPHKMAAKIRRAVKDIDKPKIVLLGASYKRNCEDIRESPAIRIAQLLETDGYHNIHLDPLVPHMGYEKLAEEARDAHLIVILVAHDCVLEEIHREWPTIEAVMARPRVLQLDGESTHTQPRNPGAQT